MRLALGALFGTFISVHALAGFLRISVSPVNPNSYYEDFGCAYNTCRPISVPQFTGNSAHCVSKGNINYLLQSDEIRGQTYFIYDVTNRCSEVVKVKVRLVSGMSTEVELRRNQRSYITTSTDSAGDIPQEIQFSTKTNSSQTPPSSPVKPSYPPRPVPDTVNTIAQCVPGMISNKVTGYSEIDITTRSFTEEISLPGVPFTLIYNSRNFQTGGSKYNKDRALGGWLMSLDSFYDRDSNTVYYANGVSYKPKESANISSDLKYRVIDPSNDSFTAFDSLGRFMYRNSELVQNTIVNTLYWDHKQTAFAGFANDKGHQFLIAKDKTKIINAAGSAYAELTYTSTGKLRSVTLPNGAQYLMDYDSSGRLKSFTKPLGKISFFEYNADGTLLKDSSSTGKSIELITGFNKETGDHENSIIFNDKSSRVHYTKSTPSITSTAISNEYGSSSTISYREIDSMTAVGDIYGGERIFYQKPSAKWKGQSLFISSETFKAGNISISKEENQTYSNWNEIRELVLNGNPKQKYILNTKKEQKYSFSSVQTPMGRTTFHFFDEKGRLSERMAVKNTPGKPTQNLFNDKFKYDASGNLQSYMDNSGNETKFQHNNLGQLSKVTDANGNSTLLTYTNVNQTSELTLPNGSQISFEYDLEGNLTSLTPQRKFKHNFQFEAGEALTKYKSPTVQHDGVEFISNSNNRLSEVKTNNQVLTKFSYERYDSRVYKIDHSHGSVSINYWKNKHNESTPLIQNLKTSDGVDIKYEYLWALPLKATTSGEISSEVSYQYNTLGYLSDIAVSGKDGIDHKTVFEYDLDGLPTRIGNNYYSLDNLGRLQTSRLGTVINNVIYNKTGDSAQESYSSGKNQILVLDFSRDKVGRITNIKSTSKEYNSNFRYDSMGRLTSASDENGLREYSYDENGNRLYFKNKDIVVQAKYDDEDKLISYGPKTYEYNDVGALTKIVDFNSITNSSKSTTFEYDTLGNLRSVKLPDGKLIEYVIDGQNRRIGKKINGTLVQGFIYQSQYRIAAETDGSGKIVRRYQYGTRVTTPDSVLIGDKEFRVISNRVGTPLMVIDASTGKVVEKLNYDEFGNEVSGKNSAYISQSFAGGLADTDTGLVRFGARDYNPETGRWTSKDPIGFMGGDTNLYAYVGNDPVNSNDPTGHFSVLGVGAGFTIGALGGGISAALTPGASRADILSAAFTSGITTAYAASGAGLVRIALVNVFAQMTFTGKINFGETIVTSLMGSFGKASSAQLAKMTGTNSKRGVEALDIASGFANLPIDIGLGYVQNQGQCPTK